MINLIPPSLRKTIIKEYWIRTVSVWLLLLSAVSVVAVLLSLPVYVLLSTQVEVYARSADEAQSRITQLDGSESTLLKANGLAQKIVALRQQQVFSDQIALLEKLQNDGIELTGFQFGLSKKAIAPVQVSGVAETRQALADYRTALLMQANIAEVVLPISNLAKDRDIEFSLAVTFKSI